MLMCTVLHTLSIFNFFFCLYPCALNVLLASISNFTILYCIYSRSWLKIFIVILFIILVFIPPKHCMYVCVCMFMSLYVSNLSQIYKEHTFFNLWRFSISFLFNYSRIYYFNNLRAHIFSMHLLCVAYASCSLIVSNKNLRNYCHFNFNPYNFIVHHHYSCQWTSIHKNLNFGIGTKWDTIVSLFFTFFKKFFLNSSFLIC